MHIVTSTVKREASVCMKQVDNLVKFEVVKLGFSATQSTKCWPRYGLLKAITIA